jgi:hypothetical protein
LETTKLLSNGMDEEKEKLVTTFDLQKAKVEKSLEKRLE